LPPFLLSWTETVVANVEEMAANEEMAQPAPAEAVMAVVPVVEAVVV